MFGDGRIPWRGLFAAATVAFVMFAAFRSSDWSRAVVNQLILIPLNEILRLSW